MNIETSRNTQDDKYSMCQMVGLPADKLPNFQPFKFSNTKTFHALVNQVSYDV